MTSSVFELRHDNFLNRKPQYFFQFAIHVSIMFNGNKKVTHYMTFFFKLKALLKIKILKVLAHKSLNPQQIIS